MQAGAYSVGITLEVEAETGQLAIEAARSAVSTLRSDTIVHAHVAVKAVPLFDDSAFAQIRGQMGFES